MSSPKIVCSFNGKRFYPYLVLSRTSKTATVQKCDSSGTPMGEPITKRYSKEHGEPAIDLNKYETVYLEMKYEV